jgi:hypothetical protein
VSSGVAGRDRVGLAGDLVDPEVADPHVDQVQQADELLVHLPEHEVQRSAQIDVLDLPLDGGLLAGLLLDLEAGVDLHVALGRRLGRMRLCGGGDVLGQLLAGSCDTACRWLLLGS